MAKRLHRIKEVLQEQERSAYWLAKETEMTYSTIHSYMHNTREPSLTNIFKIAEVLNVDPKELINSKG